MSLTYSRYLALDELLALQRPVSEGPEHDETLFIVIHQVYELWFKQLLHELDFARRQLRARSERDTTGSVLHTLRRVLTILKTMVAQIDVLETMTPMSFNSFRARLDTASGFQSPQFRELEFVLGRRDRRMVRFHTANPAAVERLEARLAESTLYQDFLAFLAACGHDIPPALLAPAGEAPPHEDETVRRTLVEIYRGDGPLVPLCERMVDLDEGIQEWRYRHVKMVERTIGTKPGTGGSPGAAYLRQTLSPPLFPDLWAIRSEL